MNEPPPQPDFIVNGNRLKLLDTGPRRLAAVIELIEQAKQSLRLLYYIYADDDTGRQINSLLIAAAQRGVAVTLIVDGFGSEDSSRRTFFTPLEQQGVTVCFFSPRFGRRFLLRNHQKLALADAEAGNTARIIIGGFNIEDDYFGTAAEQAWRDLGLLVEGNAASRMSAYFDALHAWVQQPGGKLRHLNRELGQYSEREGALRWLIGGPTRRLSPWARTVRSDMKTGKQVDIVAGYFAPSRTMLRRLDRVGQRGRELRILTAAKSDNTATIAAARFTYAGLLRKGARIFEYQPTRLHTKLYAIDEAVHIGSANFDMRSLFINLELMLRIEDAGFATHVHAYIDNEITKCREVTEQTYRQSTGWIQRIRQLGAYLLVAVVDPGISRGLNFGIDE